MREEVRGDKVEGGGEGRRRRVMRRKGRSRRVRLSYCGELLPSVQVLSGWWRTLLFVLFFQCMCTTYKKEYFW